MVRPLLLPAYLYKQIPQICGHLARYRSLRELQMEFEVIVFLFKRKLSVIQIFLRLVEDVTLWHQITGHISKSNSVIYIVKYNILTYVDNKSFENTHRNNTIRKFYSKVHVKLCKNTQLSYVTQTVTSSTTVRN